jgi:hypothetical protein
VSACSASFRSVYAWLGKQRIHPPLEAGGPHGGGPGLHP